MRGRIEFWIHPRYTDTWHRGPCRAPGAGQFQRQPRRAKGLSAQVADAALLGVLAEALSAPPAPAGARSIRDHRRHGGREGSPPSCAPPSAAVRGPASGCRPPTGGARRTTPTSKRRSCVGMTGMRGTCGRARLDSMARQPEAALVGRRVGGQDRPVAEQKCCGSVGFGLWTTRVRVPEPTVVGGWRGRRAGRLFLVREQTTCGQRAPAAATGARWVHSGTRCPEAAPAENPASGGFTGWSCATGGRRSRSPCDVRGPRRRGRSRSHRSRTRRCCRPPWPAR